MNSVTTKQALEQAREMKRERDAKRKAHALRLLRGEVTIKDTARAIGADIATIRKWKKEAGL